MASRIYICLKPLINLPTMDCLRFLLRNALVLVLSSDLQIQLSRVGINHCWTACSAETWIQGPLLWILKFLFHGSWCDWCLWLPSTANALSPRLVPSALPFLSAQRGCGLREKGGFPQSWVLVVPLRSPHCVKDFWPQTSAFGCRVWKLKFIYFIKNCAYNNFYY